ncbi:MAG: hypothetical protein V3U06_09060 [Candidatus Binatia bacterium]
MAQGKRWAEIDINRLGVLLAQALTTLERGENGKLDVDLGGRHVRIVNDPINGRVVIFELSNMTEQRKWDWLDNEPLRARAELRLENGGEKNSL